MLADLNVPWPAVPNPISLTNLSKTLIILADLGYTVVALNHTIDGTAASAGKNGGNTSKKQQQAQSQRQSKEDATINPINLSLLPIPPPQSLTILTRGTLILDDSSASHQPQRVQAMGLIYNIVAVRPKSERTMLLACTALDGIDLISLDMTVRLPCFLRHRTVGAAINRGIKFEISYAGGKDASLELVGTSSGIKLTNTTSTASNTTLSSHIGDGSGLSAISNPESRKHLVANAAHIIRSSRSKAILVSSEAYSPVVCRGPYDVVNLATTWGLDHMRARNAIENIPKAVIKSGHLRTMSYKQVIQLSTASNSSSTSKSGIKKRESESEGESNNNEHKKLKISV